ncbi:MAG: phage major capsid protein [Actinomycetota bacterium]|nr:phage major capsid protein [Actinomycetota bacterium]
MTPVEAKRLDDAVATGKRLQKRLQEIQEIDAFTSLFGDASAGAEGTETADGFAPGRGRITGAALKAVWDATSKAGGIPSSNDLKVPGVGFKDIDGGSGLLVPAQRDVEEYTLPMKPSLLTAFVPSKLITSNDFTFIRQSARVNRAAVVADGATKPTSTYTLDEVAGTLDTIAHMSEPVMNRILSDKAGLQSFLAMEMAMGLDLAAESELVAAILAADIQAQTFSVDALTSIRKGLTKLEAVYVRPDFIAVSLEDAESLDLARYTVDGHFVFDGPRTAGPNGDVWGVRLVKNDSVVTGTAIMGSAAAGLRRYVNGQADWALDTLSGFEVNTTRSRLEQRSKSVVTRPFAIVAIDLGTGS